MREQVCYMSCVSALLTIGHSLGIATEYYSFNLPLFTFNKPLLLFSVFSSCQNLIVNESNDLTMQLTCKCLNVEICCVMDINDVVSNSQLSNLDTKCDPFFASSSIARLTLAGLSMVSECFQVLLIVYYFNWCC